MSSILEDRFIKTDIIPEVEVPPKLTTIMDTETRFDNIEKSKDSVPTRLLKILKLIKLIRQHHDNAIVEVLLMKATLTTSAVLTQASSYRGETNAAIHQTVKVAMKIRRELLGDKNRQIIAQAITIYLMSYNGINPIKIFRKTKLDLIIFDIMLGTVPMIDVIVHIDSIVEIMHLGCEDIKSPKHTTEQFIAIKRMQLFRSLVENIIERKYYPTDTECKIIYDQMGDMIAAGRQAFQLGTKEYQSFDQVEKLRKEMFSDSFNDEAFFK